ncbi:hypothetical protein B2J88_52450, partial [Rhodococcus sp. SRB_17]|nr:hypothetical protein [Rhodococcus sp. SRB_17]
PFNEGSRFFYLIHDRTSSHEAEIPVTVPPGGHMAVNPDSSVTVFDADGQPVAVVDAPWAYDANGNPVPTDYEVRGGHLIQRVYADEATAYPILADPPTKGVGTKGAGTGAAAGVNAGVNAGAAAGVNAGTGTGGFAGVTAHGSAPTSDAEPAADPADSDLAQLMLADPDSQV